MGIREMAAATALSVAACSGGEVMQPEPTMLEPLPETTTSTTTIEVDPMAEGLTAEQCLVLAGVGKLIGEEGTPVYYFFGDEEGLYGGANVDRNWIGLSADTLLDSIEQPDGSLSATPAALDVIAASSTLYAAESAFDDADAVFTEINGEDGEGWKTNPEWETVYDDADAMLDQARSQVGEAFVNNCDSYDLADNSTTSQPDPDRKGGQEQEPDYFTI